MIYRTWLELVSIHWLYTRQGSVRGYPHQHCLCMILPHQSEFLFISACNCYSDGLLLQWLGKQSFLDDLTSLNPDLYRDRLAPPTLWLISPTFHLPSPTLCASCIKIMHMLLLGSMLSISLHHSLSSAQVLQLHLHWINSLPSKTAINQAPNCCDLY
jgi:hypothetical protein